MNIVITGVSKGLGAFLVSNFAKNKNNRIIGIDFIKKEDLDPSLSSYMSHFEEFDLRNVMAIPKIIKKIYALYNNIDLFINNAGMKSFGVIESLNEKTIYDTAMVNYLAPILAAKSIREIINTNGTRITVVNISSNAAFKGYPEGSIYCSSKAGLNIFTEALHQELSGNDNMSIYNLCPSTIFLDDIKTKFPYAKPKDYISPDHVYNEIVRLLNNPPKIPVIPLIPFRQNIKYIIYDLKRYVYWLQKKLIHKG